MTESTHGKFEDHPDSVVKRLRAQSFERISEKLRDAAAKDQQDEGPNWLDLTFNSTDEEIETRMTRIAGQISEKGR